MNATVTTGIERWRVDFDAYYAPYPKQNAFHASTARHRLLGGAAGPGKTLALIADHLISCSEFSIDDARQVKTLLLRRTHPKLASTVVARFEEKIPRELYTSFNRQMGIVKWLNGAETRFGSMQYEHDVMGWQGQWLKIGYDELTEFTFRQWSGISAWNRCPVSKWSTKDGATNPIGIGADWVEHLFVMKKPWPEMDTMQKAQYLQERDTEYTYFPCTYLDNPIYANDPVFLANLQSYPAAIRQALMEGKWGVSGGYFQGAWDEAVNVYAAESVVIKPHWRKWLSGDWGFEHNSAIYKHALTDWGTVLTYGELVFNHKDAEQIGEAIAEFCHDASGRLEKELEAFSFSHDAFAATSEGHAINSRAQRVGDVLAKYGLPRPIPSTRDKIGREQLMYEKLRSRIKLGVRLDEQGNQIAEETAAWQIADTCHHLIRVIPRAPRDEKNVEEVAEFAGDDPLQGSGYGLYYLFGKPSAIPFAERMAAELSTITDATSRAVQAQRLIAGNAKKEKPTGRLRWMRRN
ncbi:MAG: hypothetical protein ACRD8A_12750 [Candidatus Acidiferrales bacterium]